MNLRLPEPTALQSAATRHITRQDRWAFFSTLCVGLLTHLYMLLNKFPNHDDFLSTITKNVALSSGRWFLSVPSAISSQLSLPWVNGLLALLCLSLAMVLVMRLLHIRRRGLIFLGCGIMAVFPSLTYTLCYMYTADAYVFALLLTVVGAYVLDRYKWGLLPGAILMGLAVGCYQAYFFFGVALLGTKGILLLVSPETDNKTVLKTLARYLLALGLGMGFYYGMLQLLLAVNNTVLTDYMGINSLSGTGIGQLLMRMPDTYRRYAEYLTGDSWVFSGRIQVLAFLLANLLSLGLCVYCFFRGSGKTLLKGLLLLGMVALWPLLYSGIGLLGTEIIHPLMLYSLGLVFLLPLALCGSLLAEEPTHVPALKRQMQLLLTYGLVLLLSVSGLSFARHANETYFALQLKFENTMALCNRIVDRVEQTPGYTRETPVWFQGTIYEGNYPAVKGDAFGRASNTPVTALSWEFGFLMNNLYFSTFAMYYLGVYFPQPSHETVTAIMETEAYQSMPYFPYEGSVKTIDGIIFVRVGPGGTVW